MDLLRAGCGFALGKLSAIFPGGPLCASIQACFSRGGFGASLDARIYVIRASRKLDVEVNCHPRNSPEGSFWRPFAIVACDDMRPCGLFPTFLFGDLCAAFPYFLPLFLGGVPLSRLVSSPPFYFCYVRVCYFPPLVFLSFFLRYPNPICCDFHPIFSMCLLQWLVPEGTLMAASLFCPFPALSF